MEYLITNKTQVYSTELCFNLLINRSMYTLGFGHHIFCPEKLHYTSIVLTPSQNVRRLRFNQKSTFYKFDQIYTKKYEYLHYQMDILRNYTFW
jgi:hypothetical protein